MNSLRILGAFVALMIGLTVYAAYHEKTVTATAVIGGRSHEVLVANSPQAHYRGLSGKTPETLGAAGMYFPFSDSAERTFVMRGMLFPLDFIWLRDGRVVKIEENVPFPEPGESPQFVYSKPEKADGVLEFPAGFVQKSRVIIGDMVIIR